MSPEEAMKFKPGMKIFWIDPDEGICSRWYNIQKISVYPETNLVRITDKDGSHIECYADELTNEYRDVI
jgi:hypothetical protein